MLIISTIFLKNMLHYMGFIYDIKNEIIPYGYIQLHHLYV